MNLSSTIDRLADMVTVEDAYKVSAEGKRLLGAIATHEYCMDTLDNIIDSLDVSAEAKRSLRKKLNGKKYETDVKNLIAYGVDEEIATDTAFLIAEVIVWQGIERLTEDNDTDINRIYADVLSAVNVNYTIKVAVDD